MLRREHCKYQWRRRRWSWCKSSVLFLLVCRLFSRLCWCCGKLLAPLRVRRWWYSGVVLAVVRSRGSRKMMIWLLVRLCVIYLVVGVGGKHWRIWRSLLQVWFVLLLLGSSLDAQLWNICITSMLQAHSHTHTLLTANSKRNRTFRMMTIYILFSFIINLFPLSVVCPPVCLFT